jgi:hypothetical protein
MAGRDVQRLQLSFSRIWQGAAWVGKSGGVLPRGERGFGIVPIRQVRICLPAIVRIPFVFA